MGDTSSLHGTQVLDDDVDTGYDLIDQPPLLDAKSDGFTNEGLSTAREEGELDDDFADAEHYVPFDPISNIADDSYPESVIDFEFYVKWDEEKGGFGQAYVISYYDSTLLRPRSLCYRRFRNDTIDSNVVVFDLVLDAVKRMRLIGEFSAIHMRGGCSEFTIDSSFDLSGMPRELDPIPVVHYEVEAYPDTAIMFAQVALFQGFSSTHSMEDVNLECLRNRCSKLLLSESLPQVSNDSMSFFREKMEKNTLETFYAVARGRVPGVYKDLDEAKEQIVGFSGSCLKSFNTRAEADQYVEENKCKIFYAVPTGPNAGVYVTKNRARKEYDRCAWTMIREFKKQHEAESYVKAVQERKRQRYFVVVKGRIPGIYICKKASKAQCENFPHCVWEMRYNYKSAVDFFKSGSDQSGIVLPRSPSIKRGTRNERNGISSKRRKRNNSHIITM